MFREVYHFFSCSHSNQLSVKEHYDSDLSKAHLVYLSVFSHISAIQTEPVADNPTSHTQSHKMGKIMTMSIYNSIIIITCPKSHQRLCLRHKVPLPTPVQELHE